MISADLLIRNSRLNRLLFCECKDGGLELDQANRYSTLTDEDINVMIAAPREDLEHEVTYLGTDDKADKLINGIKANEFKFPVLVYKDSKVLLEHNHFKCSTLERIFGHEQGVKIKNYSMTYYPFGVDDSNIYILHKLIPTLLRFMGMDEEFNAEDLLRDTHSSIFNYMSNPSSDELKGKISRILKEASTNESLSKYFDKGLDKTFKLKRYGQVGFKKALEKYISERCTHKGSQKSLFDF
jgi:hypothetical protein